MIIKADSPFRRLPSTLDGRRLRFLDGIRYAIEMADLAHQRLRDTAHQTSVARINEQPVRHIFPLIFLDAWSLVDSVNRLRVLLNRMDDQRRTPEVRAFTGITARVQEVRDGVQHLDDRIDQLASQGQTVWGYVSWVAKVTPGQTWFHSVVAGAIIPNMTLLETVYPPSRPPQPPVDQINLSAFGVTISISETMDSVGRIARTLEGHLAKEFGKVPGLLPDAWVSMGADDIGGSVQQG